MTAILKFIISLGCSEKLWQNKTLQIIIFHNTCFSHITNPAWLTENQSVQLSSKHSLHTSSRWMLKELILIAKLWLYAGEKFKNFQNKKTQKEELNFGNPWKLKDFGFLKKV